MDKRRHLLGKNAVKEYGIEVDDAGNINSYSTLNLKPFYNQIKKARAEYVKGEEMWHVFSLPYEIYDNIRVSNGFPNTKAGWDRTREVATKKYERGELKAFEVHNEAT